MASGILNKHSANVDRGLVGFLVLRSTHTGAQVSQVGKEITSQTLETKTQPFERGAVHSASAGRPQHPRR